MATDSDRDLPVNSASIESTGRRNLIDLIPSNMAAPILKHLIWIGYLSRVLSQVMRISQGEICHQEAVYTS